MPTYQYQCPEGHSFEKFQKMSGRPRANCPECGRPAQRRITGGAGLVFKGSGFYITDYGKDGKGRAPAGEGAAAAAEKPATAGKDAPATGAPAKASTSPAGSE
jgi:putative FmdB family regulatory protein